MDLGHARWRKSSRSNDGDEDQECVEVAFVPGTVGVRDSKNPDAGALVLPERAWRSALPTFR